MGDAEKPCFRWKSKQGRVGDASCTLARQLASALILDRIDAQSGCVVVVNLLLQIPSAGLAACAFGVSSFNAAGVGSCHSGDRWYRGVTTSATAGKSGGGEKLNYERPN